MIHQWGESHVVHRSESQVVVKAEAVGGCSSLHFHQGLTNTFIGGTACIDIEVHAEGGLEYVRLEQGSVLEVPHGVPHRLIVVDPGFFWEVYEWGEEVTPTGPPDPEDQTTRMEEGSPVWNP